MLEKISNSIVTAQINAGLLNKDDKAIYVYGYILAIEVLMNILVGILVAALLNAIDIAVVFWMIYIPLRSFSGGWHAQRSWQCLIISNVALVIVIKLEAVITTIISFPLEFVLVLTLALLICFLSPVGTKHKEINLNEKVKYKKISIFILLTELIIFFFIKRIRAVMLISYVILLVSLIAQIFINNMNDQKFPD